MKPPGWHTALDGSDQGAPYFGLKSGESIYWPPTLTANIRNDCLDDSTCVSGRWL
jgi:hypothetical protein